jgi:hypothetical protein
MNARDDANANHATCRKTGGFLLIIALSLGAMLSARAANPRTIDDRPAGWAEITGSESAWSGDSNRPPGPAVRISEIDGKRVSSRPAEKPHFISHGWHKVRLAIIRVDIESQPTFEFPVEANRKYKFIVAPAGYEYRVRLFDVTSMPEGLLFEAIVTRSKTPKITWVRPPRVAKPPEQSDSPGGKQAAGISHHPRPQQLEVAAFQAVRVNGVIHAGAGAVEDLEAAVEAVHALDHAALEILQ